jgi:hypothetical protein
LQADRVADDLSGREAALRKLPVPYSLALRLREAGVAREVICEYVGVEDASLDGIYRIADEKLFALQTQREAPVKDPPIRASRVQHIEVTKPE